MCVHVGCFLNNKDTLAIWDEKKGERSEGGMIYREPLLSLSCSILWSSAEQRVVSGEILRHTGRERSLASDTNCQKSPGALLGGNHLLIWSCFQSPHQMSSLSLQSQETQSIPMGKKNTINPHFSTPCSLSPPP